MATPVAPEPEASDSTKSDCGQRSRQGGKRTFTPTASLCPSGTRKTFPRPSIVPGVGREGACHERIDTVKSLADTRARVWSPESTTAITCPAELVCSSASQHPSPFPRPSSPNLGSEPDLPPE